MAKKGNRVVIALVCSECKNRNYLSSRNTINIKDKIVLNKYCKHCRKATEHTEITKLK